MLEIYDFEAKLSFCQDAVILSISSIFREPKKRDEIWVDFVNILCVVAAPAETELGKKM